VVLGATGTVGRELVGLLAPREDLDLVVAGRNRVLLEHLRSAFPVDVLTFDSTAMSAAALPRADVLVDLTYSLTRHPRWVVAAAERSADLLLEYLRLHRDARVVHTGTFAILNERPELASELSDRLVWRSSYLLSKSAMERALRRQGPLERLAVIRLGNMAVPDMTWTTAILKALRDGAVSTPAALSRRANLSDARLLARAIFEDRDQLSYLPDMAGFTWGEVIGAVAAETGQPPLDHPDGEEDAGAPGRSMVGPLVRRVLYAAPLSAARGPLEGLPAARVWLGPGRKIVRRDRSGAAFPPALPLDRPLPGAARDQRRFRDLIDDLAALFERRGWRPLTGGDVPSSRGAGGTDGAHPRDPRGREN
jgi:nucleoside-diphosphate-sugar epimerase